MINFIRAVVVEFSQDRGFLFAAAISFFGLISLIPLVLLAVGIFGIVIGSREGALQQVLNFLNNFIPVGNDILETYLRTLSRESKVLSWIGFAGLLWAGMQVFIILQQVMNVALGATKKLGFFRVRAVAILLVLIAGGLFTVSIGITSTLAAARHYGPEILGIRVSSLYLLWRFVGILAPMLISTMAFTFIYKFAPTESIGTAGPIIGGVAAAVLFEVAKFAFKWYVTHIVNYSVVYGSLGSVVILVFWTYYVSVITVFGAEVASVYARREGGHKE